MTHPQPPAPRQTALVTGASSGIGLELARILAEHSYDVVLVARRGDVLERIAAELRATHGISATALPLDLSRSDAPGELARTLHERGIAVDVLVNNAGFGTRGQFTETSLDTELAMIQVNVSALTALTKLFLPTMVQRGHGRIMNVASTAAFQPGPMMAVYYATKAYVLSFSQAVAEEVRDTGVTITALCPGPTHTNFAKVAHMGTSRLFRSGLVMQSYPVARAGFDGMMRGERVVIPGLVNRIAALGATLAPRGLVTRLSRLVQERR